jgi:hypothetical protein
LGRGEFNEVRWGDLNLNLKFTWGRGEDSKWIFNSFGQMWYLREVGELNEVWDKCALGIDYVAQKSIFQLEGVGRSVKWALTKLIQVISLINKAGEN